MLTRVYLENTKSYIRVLENRYSLQNHYSLENLR